MPVLPVYSAQASKLLASSSFSMCQVAACKFLYVMQITTIYQSVISPIKGGSEQTLKCPCLLRLRRIFYFPVVTIEYATEIGVMLMFIQSLNFYVKKPHRSSDSHCSPLLLPFKIPEPRLKERCLSCLWTA